MRFILIVFLIPITCFAENIEEESLKKWGEFVNDIGANKNFNMTMIDGFIIESALTNKIIMNTDISKSTLSDEEIRILNISKPDSPSITLGQAQNKEKSYGISVFRKDSGEPTLAFDDRNGDGRFDYLTYSVFDNDGKYIKEVTDYGADGQIDIIIDLEKGEGKIYYKGVWVSSNNEKGFVFNHLGESLTLSQARAYFDKTL